MRNIRLTIEYDGSRYQGWARLGKNESNNSISNKIIEVLEKMTGLALGDQDVYINVVSGMKLSEPATDLGVVVAVASSFKNIPIPKDWVCIGEVGLTGEIRTIGMVDKRLKEAEKLGFKTAIIPKNNKKLFDKINL